MVDAHTPSSMSPPVADRESPMSVSASDLTRLNSESYSSSNTVDASEGDLPLMPSHHCFQLDAVQTHWTDEKHRLFLDSLEASFVQDLHRYRHLRAFSSKQKVRRKLIMPNISSSEVRQYIHSKSGRKPCTLETTDVLEECGSCSDRRHIRNKTNSCQSARSSQQIPSCCRDSHTIFTEVSDQNFVDTHPGELSDGTPITKRLKKASSDSSGNDRVKLGIAFDLSLENQ
ncbi:uncharacterized protein LOC111811294 isoform X3 [Cucurbita pepo subsp. pepo]|uniref:uncharacterized protein LOC111811294 isoform X3 n=1 Tax=Cucurbita pepo subsp. pepo TaxID=3664 RepID=UPI000C9D5AB3|nr:uncharacterized protein LOC111811294 isoform X3 [Cucurbita pepo subsp. pepo]